MAWQRRPCSRRMTSVLVFPAVGCESIGTGARGGEGRMTDYRRLFDLAGRKALVLGAASGIGKASAEALGALGAAVHCADLDLAGAQATAATIRAAGGTADASRADASSGEDIAALVARAKAALGRIDVAVTTPGVNIRKLVLDYSEA